MEENRSVYLVKSGGRYYFLNEFTLETVGFGLLFAARTKRDNTVLLVRIFPNRSFSTFMFLYSFSRSLWPPRHFGHPG